jgi:hypothetical protein
MTARLEVATTERWGENTLSVDLSVGEASTDEVNVRMIWLAGRARTGSRPNWSAPTWSGR